MTRTTSADRREKLRRRVKKVTQERGQTGLGKKSVLNVDNIDKKIHRYAMETGKTRNTIDILPFIITQDWYKNLRSKSGTTTGLKVGDMDYKLEYPVHKGIGENNDTFLCLRLAFGKKCLICEEMFEEWEKADVDQDEKKLRALKPSWRDAYNVYDYAAPDKDIQLWEDQSYFLFEDILIEEMETDPDGLSAFCDLEEGKSIEFRGREKSIGRTTFAEAHSLNFINRDKYEESVLEDVFPLDAMLIIPGYDDVAKAHLGLDDMGSTPDEPESRIKDEPESKHDEQTQTSPRRPPRRQQKEVSETASKIASEPDDPAKIECPAHGIFGVDCNRLKQCADCEETIFTACANLQDNLANLAKTDGQEAEKPEEKPEETSIGIPARTSRRNSRRSK